MRNIFKWLSGKESKGDNIEGWNNLQWGMTEEAILKAFEGQAEQLLESLQFARSYANLRIRDMDIGGNQHEVLFQMDVETNRLGQILLRPKEKPSQNTFKELEKTLIQIYGTPNHTVNEEEGAYQHYERTWHFPTTTIVLNFLDFGLPTDSIETTKIMTLQYRPNK